MKKFVLPLLLAISLGGAGACTSVNTASSPGLTVEQAQAGAEYLKASITKLQEALDAAKATGDPAKVAAAQSVLDQAQKAAAAFESSLPSGKQEKWDAARSLLTTATGVLAPIAIQALVSGS